ncbi:Glu/Leu/Phe/Val dehydrogenase dimerization domain-containing protein [Desulfoluna spongiiphila]|uniref:Glutamate dehydrogenase/leucine dehydrogenase n=1 Tax=Desulfoluna spongiiphila TaxID=419481 RepID=A0A1G5AKE6_9BACT|nr:Glu/Leu/Phe/Val dehydrogenase dimerization domain-containing protein [Desulfoluna spongiiphila]SCX78333.1 Glutamate dehydrogenase/leucine dehydrogenase [Desulfoluna spongiiphila]
METTPTVLYHLSDSGVRDKLRGMDTRFVSDKEVYALYNHLRHTYDLKPDTILDSIETVLTKTDLGPYFYRSLSTEEIAFLIAGSRYQEAMLTSRHASGSGEGINVTGRFGNKHLFFISETRELVRETLEAIKALMRENPVQSFRMSSYVVCLEGNPDANRRLYIVEGETPGVRKPGLMRHAAHHMEEKLGAVAEKKEVVDFLGTATEGFVHALLHNQRIRTLENYFTSWKRVVRRLKKGKTVHICIDQNIIADEPVPERRLQLWLPYENFRNNLTSIEGIFEKKGIPFTRQYFETFVMGNRRMVAFSTYIADSLITPELDGFLRNELSTRSILMKGDPIPTGQIGDFLGNLGLADSRGKLAYLGRMQAHRHKEYLIPLVFLLSDPNERVRKIAFDTIRNYLMAPDGEMKSDYYWATLYHIFAAATVPVEIPGSGKRALFGDEISRLVRFRGIHYESYFDDYSGKSCLFIRMNGEGIGKGGIRCHKTHVSFSGEGALSTNMLFKSLGLGIPYYATGKGGILGSLGKGEVRERVLAAYGRFLFKKAGIGPFSDVPAGDVGVGPSEIGALFEIITDEAARDLAAIAEGSLELQAERSDRLRRHFGINVADAALVATLASDREELKGYTSSAITGKPGGRGLALRTGATARGLYEVLAVLKGFHRYSDPDLWLNPSRIDEALDTEPEFYNAADANIRMLSFAIQGFGKVGGAFAGIVHAKGASVHMISDAGGTLVNLRGIPQVERLVQGAASGKGLAEMVEKGMGRFVEGDTTRPLTAMVDVVVPAALEEVVTLDAEMRTGAIHASRVEADYILQGANGPLTPEAETYLEDRGRISIPDILANAGGVLGSYLEWVDGLIKMFGYGKVTKYGLVHPVVQGLVRHHCGQGCGEDLHAVDELVYSRAFRFIMRGTAMGSVRLASERRISLRTAWMAEGIAAAAREGRLDDSFGDRVAHLRTHFASPEQGASQNVRPVVAR